MCLCCPLKNNVFKKKTWVQDQKIVVAAYTEELFFFYKCDADLNGSLVLNTINIEVMFQIIHSVVFQSLIPRWSQSWAWKFVITKLLAIIMWRQIESLCIHMEIQKCVCLWKKVCVCVCIHMCTLWDPFIPFMAWSVELYGTNICFIKKLVLT